MAWAGAELLAAETGLSARSRPPATRWTQLALVFTVDAVVALLDRLDAMLAETGEDPAAVDALRAAPEWRALRCAVGGAEAPAGRGPGRGRGPGLVGDIALDEAHALAQDAFRRFAAEVAPQAEAIHRHDLTVPESLLQPMREMGVFGLAIPERFGGSAPDGREDTLLMVVVTEALSEGLAGGRGQPDHAARDPHARAACGRHRRAEGALAAAVRPASRCAPSP